MQIEFIIIFLVIVCVICYFACLSMINAHLKRKDANESIKNVCMMVSDMNNEEIDDVLNAIKTMSQKKQ